MVIFNISCVSRTPSPATSNASTDGTPDSYNTYNWHYGTNMNNHDRWVAVPNISHPVHVQDIRHAMEARRNGVCNAPFTDCQNPPTKQNIGGVMKKMQFCDYHACVYFDEDGKVCSNPKKPGNDRYCDDREFHPSPQVCAQS